MIANLIIGNKDLQKHPGLLLIDKQFGGKGIFKPSYLKDGSKRSDVTAHVPTKGVKKEGPSFPSRYPKVDWCFCVQRAC
jgi:hypothetical protein